VYGIDCGVVVHGCDVDFGQGSSFCAFFRQQLHGFAHGMLWLLVIHLLSSMIIITWLPGCGVWKEKVSFVWEGLMSLSVSTCISCLVVKLSYLSLSSECPLIHVRCDDAVVIDCTFLIASIRLASESRGLVAGRVEAVHLDS
jgi:hypothetical protein